MPNGEDKNFVRLCWAISGFHSRYGRWPTRVCIYPAALANLRTLFDEEALAALNARVTLVASDAPFLAEDEEGSRYDLQTDGIPQRTDFAALHAWLGVQPHGHNEPGA